MAIPYTRPGVTVNEVTSSVVQPLLGEATSVCLVGPAQGYQEYTETMVLDDNTPQALSAKFPDLDTLVVVDASDLTLDPFTPSTTTSDADYDIDSSELSTTGTVTVARAMQTSIPNGESVVLYYENLASETQETSFTNHLELNGLTPAAPTSTRTDLTGENAFVVSSPGLIAESEYVLTGEGTDDVTLELIASPEFTGKFQEVFYDYDEAVQCTYSVSPTGGPTGGNYVLRFNYLDENCDTAVISYSANAAAVESALDTAVALHTTLGTGNVRVNLVSGDGSSGDPYVFNVVFHNELAADAGEGITLSLHTNSLTGGASPTVAVSETQAGALGDHVRNVAVQLNGTTPVALDADIVNVIVKNQSSLIAPTTESNLYTVGVSGAGDYTLNGSGETLTISRSNGSTSMNTTANRITVRVSYRATPVEYWSPTRVFSQIDAEAKYGAAMTSAGEINSPVSFAASIMFDNGASNVIIQPLFAESAAGVRTTSTGLAADWESTLANLRGLQGVNLIVPLVASGLTSTDTLISSILSKVRSHVVYMKNNQQKRISVVAGSDSTQYGQGSRAALRALAQEIRVSNSSPDEFSEHFTILNQGTVRMSNPITNLEMLVGGQYAAAAVAGGLARRKVQEPITRKGLVGIRGLGEFITEDEMDIDADAGLCVLRSSSAGSIEVRHGITVSNATVASRELNVVRAKFYHIQVMRDTLDQLIGTLLADEEAPFSVQLAAVSALESLREEGAIVGWDSPQARQMTGDPTHVKLRYRYLPAFPLNYITVEFGLNTQSGSITTNIIGA